MRYKMSTIYRYFIPFYAPGGGVGAWSVLSRTVVASTSYFKRISIMLRKFSQSSSGSGI